MELLELDDITKNRILIVIPNFSWSLHSQSTNLNTNSNNILDNKRNIHKKINTYSFSENANLMR